MATIIESQTNVRDRTVDMSAVHALDGKEIVLVSGETEPHAYPVDSFRNIELGEWTGSPKGHEENEGAPAGSAIRRLPLARRMG